MKKYLINYSSFILCLIPFVLLTGPFFPDFFLSQISLIFLFLTFRDKEWHYYHNYFFYIFIIFYIYLLLIASTSDYPYESIKDIFFYFRFGIFSLAIWFILDKKPKTIKIFTISILLSFCISYIDTFYQLLNDVNLFGFQAVEGRSTLLLNDKMILGGYLSRLFPLLVGLLILTQLGKRNLNNIFLFLIFFLTPIAILTSGERTALGLFFILLIILIVLLSGVKYVKIFAFLLSLSIIIFTLFTNNEIRDRTINHTLNQFKYNNIVSDGRFQFYSIDHDRVFRSSLEMFKKNKIFGVGPGLFRKHCSMEEYSIDENSCSTHPHNTYMQLLAETGLIGTLYVLAFFLYSIFVLSKVFLYNRIFGTHFISDFQTCLLVCFFISLWPLFPTQNFFNNWINIIYFLPIGFYLYSINTLNIIKKS